MENEKAATLRQREFVTGRNHTNAANTKLRLGVVYASQVIRVEIDFASKARSNVTSKYALEALF